MDREIIEEVETGATRNGAGRHRASVGSGESTAIRVMALLADAFASRFLVFVTAGSCLGMAWWTVVHPSTLGIVATAAAAVTVLAPVLWRDAKVGG